MYKLTQCMLWPYQYHILFNRKVIGEIRLRVILDDDDLQKAMMWDENKEQYKHLQFLIDCANE